MKMPRLETDTDAAASAYAGGGPARTCACRQPWLRGCTGGNDYHARQALRGAMVIVLDTNTLVAATLSPFGASFQILTMIPQRRFDLLLSVPLMLEYEEMLKREDVRAKSHLTVEGVDVLLDMLAAV